MRRRNKENFHPLLDVRVNIVMKMSISLRYLIPSLLEYLLVRLIVLWVLSPLSWKTVIEREINNLI